MVPTYAPGLPLIMAAALTLGACGPYLVVPVFAALLVWLTFVWGRRVAGPLAGLIAALFILTSPTVVFQTLWPMSDVPSGAMWTAAAIAATTGTRRSAVAAGLLTAVALLIRPNLPLVALVIVFEVALTARGWERWIRLAAAAVPVAIVAMLVAVLNTAWFGAPGNSGYGPPRDLYSLASIMPNLARYPVWLWQSQTAWVLTALLPLVPAIVRGVPRAPVRMAYLLTAATALSYLAYIPFEEWWYLRFMLPAAGAFTVLMATGIIGVARRLPREWGLAFAAVAVMSVVLHATSFTSDRSVFGIRGAERRYALVGDFISRSLPDSALVFTMQHSGAVRFYGGRLSLRYDNLDSEWVQDGPAELERLGYHPYLVIDDWETPEVKKRFQLKADAPLPWTPIARYDDYGGVTVFDMAAHPAAQQPVLIVDRGVPLYQAPRSVVLKAHR
jgi:hypothetical protein